MISGICAYTEKPNTPETDAQERVWHKRERKALP